jgi:uncharacterized membrane protein YdjX (TVP38/TMEM64 family)
MSQFVKRFLPLFVLGILSVLAYIYDLHTYLTFQSLRDNRIVLLDYVQEHQVLAPLFFVLIYAGVVALSVPGATFMTLTGGFLFGAVMGTAYVVLGATLGATILFLAARTAFSELLRKRAGPWMQKMSKGFQENEINYMLFLRLVPLFPFFIVNIVPAFFGVRVSVFVLTTLVGIIPGAFVYANVGDGIGSIFDVGGKLSLQSIMTPQLILSFTALGVLAIIPVIYQRFKGKR